MDELRDRGFSIDRDAKRGVRLTRGELLKEQPEPKSSGRIKGTRKQELDGILFDSKREASTYLKLKMQEQAGLIKDLVVNASFTRTHKIKYQLRFDGWAQEWYEPDFEWTDVKTGEKITADAKGYKTDVYKKKKRLMKKIYGIEIVEL